MSALNIQIPDSLRARIEKRAADGGFATVEAYVEAMLRADAADAPVVDDEQLESMLLDRLDGPFVDADDADLKQMRAKLEKRLDDEAGKAP